MEILNVLICFFSLAPFNHDRYHLPSPPLKLELLKNLESFQDWLLLVLDALFAELSKLLDECLIGTLGDLNMMII